MIGYCLLLFSLTSGLVWAQDSPSAEPEISAEVEDPNGHLDPALSQQILRLFKAHQSATGQILFLGLYRLPENQDADTAVEDHFERLIGDPSDPLFSQSPAAKSALIALFPESSETRIRVAFGLDTWLDTEQVEHLQDVVFARYLDLSVSLAVAHGILSLFVELESPVIASGEAEAALGPMISKIRDEMRIRDQDRPFPLFFLLLLPCIGLLALYMQQRKEIHFSSQGVFAVNGALQTLKDIRLSLKNLFSSEDRDDTNSLGVAHGRW